jgi:hypothetical protein
MARLVIAVLAIAALGGPATGHVMPSVDDNNRFLKLTPLGDRVRLAYTVLFGDNPGRGMRPALDTNHDGLVGEDEAQAFGAKLAAEVDSALDIEIDGKPYTLSWAEVVVGMGMPQTTGGTFAVDLIGYLCLPAPRGAHHIRFRDRFALTRAGETEVAVEDSPGVTISRARIGRADDPSHDYRLAGSAPALAEDGLELAFDAGDRAVIAKDGLCEIGRASGGGHAMLIGGVVGVGVVALGAVGFALMRRRPAA